MNKCKAPKEFIKFMHKEITTFLVPCCYIVNGRFNMHKLSTRIKALKLVEAQLQMKIRSLEALHKSMKE